MPNSHATMHDTYEAFLAAHPAQSQVVNGHAWEYLAAGHGSATLLLLPGGFGLASTSWQYVLAFAPHCRVISLHYPPGIATIAELCDGVIALLGALSIGQAHMLGGSASGAVAQVLVRRHPARVASLILAQTGPPQPRRAARAEHWARLVERLPLLLVRGLLRGATRAFLPLPTGGHRFWRQHFGQVIAAQSRTGLANRFRLLADYDRNYRFAPSDLAAWPGRVAIIESAADGFVPADERAALRALYPQAWVHTFAQGSHGLSLHHPEQQIAAIKGFLQPYLSG